MTLDTDLLTPAVVAGVFLLIAAMIRRNATLGASQLDHDATVAAARIAAGLDLDQLALEATIDGHADTIDKQNREIEKLRVEAERRDQIDEERLEQIDMLSSRATRAAFHPEFTVAAPTETTTTTTIPPTTTVRPIQKDPFEKTPRNAPCPCGSGRKFKNCHGDG